MRRFALFFISLISVLQAVASVGQDTVYTVESVPNVRRVDVRRHVSDPAGLLSAAARDTIDALFCQLEAATGIEAAVVMVPSIGDAVPVDFAQALFRYWGIGKESSNNGLLILFVGDQKSIRFHTGYGIEGFLTDALCKRIQTRRMLPAFRQGDISGGMVAGCMAVCAVLDGSMEPETDGAGGVGWGTWIILAAILCFALYMTGAFGHHKQRCPACGKRALDVMSTDYYRGANGHRMRKRVLVCGNCGRVKVEHTDMGGDNHGGSGLGAFLGGLFIGSLLSGGRGGFGGGGGFRGGSFGGGDSGGGGAGSNW